MCKSTNEGGRRCPEHQPIVQQSLAILEQNFNLSKKEVRESLLGYRKNMILDENEPKYIDPEVFNRGIEASYSSFNGDINQLLMPLDTPENEWVDAKTFHTLTSMLPSFFRHKKNTTLDDLAKHLKTNKMSAHDVFKKFKLEDKNNENISLIERSEEFEEIKQRVRTNPAIFQMAQSYASDYADESNPTVEQLKLFKKLDDLVQEVNSSIKNVTPENVKTIKNKDGKTFFAYSSDAQTITITTNEGLSYVYYYDKEYSPYVKNLMEEIQPLISNKEDSWVEAFNKTEEYFKKNDVPLKILRDRQKFGSIVDGVYENSRCSDCGQFISVTADIHICPKLREDEISLMQNTELISDYQKNIIKKIAKLETANDVPFNEKFIEFNGDMNEFKVSFYRTVENENVSIENLVIDRDLREFKDYQELSSDIGENDLIITKEQLLGYTVPMSEEVSLDNIAYIIKNASADRNNARNIGKYSGCKDITFSPVHNIVDAGLDKLVQIIPDEKLLKDSNILKYIINDSPRIYGANYQDLDNLLKNGEKINVGNVIYGKENNIVDVIAIPNTCIKVGCSKKSSNVNNMVCQHIINFKNLIMNDFDKSKNSHYDFESERLKDLIESQNIQVEKVVIQDSMKDIYVKTNELYGEEYSKYSQSIDYVFNVISEKIGVKPLKEYSHEEITQIVKTSIIAASFIEKGKSSLSKKEKKSLEKFYRLNDNFNLNFLVPYQAGFWVGDKQHFVTGHVPAIIHNESNNSINKLGANTARNLKCTCSDYAEKYYCEHVNYVSRQEVGETPSMGKENAELKMVLAQLINKDSTIIDEDSLEGLMYGSFKSQIKITDDLKTIKPHFELYSKTQKEINGTYSENLEQYFVDSKAHNEKIQEKFEEEKNNSTQFASNPEIFFEKYMEGINDRRNNREAIEYKYENVTNGICSAEAGARKFGLEMEVVFNDHKENIQDYEKMAEINNLKTENIIRELRLAGLTTQSEDDGAARYHSGKQKGYEEWSIELDGTVDLEIVSPPLYDSPECWEQIKTVTEILKRNGAKVDERCGGHISISTGSYQDDSKKVNAPKTVELKRTFDENIEILARLGQDTSKGHHRGYEWCKPDIIGLSEEVKAYDNIPELGQKSALNISSLNANPYDGNIDPLSSRAEFRIFDGSLEPSILQQRIKLAASITQHAENKVASEGISRARNINENVEAKKSREKILLIKQGRTTHNLETFTEDSKEVAQLIDELFTRDSDKEDIAKLFAITKW